MKGSVHSPRQCMQVIYFFNCCSIHKLSYGHFCFSPYAVNAIFNFSCVCVVSNRFLLVPLSQWCLLAVRKYIHIIFFHWYLIYLKVNIYIIAIFLCDIQFVDKKIDIFWYIFFVIYCSFSHLITQGTHTFICKLHMEIKCDLKFYRFCSWIYCWVKWNDAMFYFMWFVSNFTVGFTRLLLSSHVSLLVINLVTIWINGNE